MGLDMYLSGKRYMSKVFREDDEPKQNAIAKLFPELEGWTGRWGDASPVKEVSIDVGYWRKANAVHDWFVREVQGGEDDCSPYYVAREQLLELKEACEKVLADKSLAPELLPTASGFFFGSTDYNQYYFEDLESTIKIIDRVLTLPTDWEFEYRSSW
jgi:hypothetical protein